VDTNVVPTVVYKHINTRLNLHCRHTEPKPIVSSRVQVSNYDKTMVY